MDMQLRMTTLCLLVTVGACASGSAYNPLSDYEEVAAATILDAPAARSAPDSPEGRRITERGQYLVELLGCGSCHTDGALIGEPVTERALAGSRIGIAWTNPMEFDNPGVVFAPNLTPDVETGLGRWSEAQIIEAIRAGAGRHGSQRILVMPWQGYARLRYDDAFAIARYLKNLEPVAHQVPAAVPAGRRSNERFVHFGVYRSR